MPVRSATSYAGGTFPAFPLGGPTRIVEVTESWTALLAGSSTDYVLLDVPEGTKMVIAMSSTEALEGTLATIDQSRQAMRWRPGYYEFCVDRDGSGPVVYVAIDPSDGSDDADRAEVRVTEAAT